MIRIKEFIERATIELHLKSKHIPEMVYGVESVEIKKEFPYSYITIIHKGEPKCFKFDFAEFPQEAPQWNYEKLQDYVMGEINGLCFALQNGTEAELGRSIKLIKTEEA